MGPTLTLSILQTSKILKKNEIMRKRLKKIRIYPKFELLHMIVWKRSFETEPKKSPKWGNQKWEHSLKKGDFSRNFGFGCKKS